MQQCEFESNNGGTRVAYEVAKIVDERGGRCNITDKTTSSNKETKIIVNADWVKDVYKRQEWKNIENNALIILTI